MNNLNLNLGPAPGPGPQTRLKLELHIGTGEWSALYVDGKLYVIGDHYLADEAIRKLCGVVTVESGDFLRGGDGVARKAAKDRPATPGPAQTLDEVHEYTRDRLERQRRVERLRTQAASLTEQANLIESGQVL